jgi:hypothetical protein
MELADTARIKQQLELQLSDLQVKIYQIAPPQYILPTWKQEGYRFEKKICVW